MTKRDGCIKPTDGALCAAANKRVIPRRSALDRLERAGYARRVRHPSARRGVLIEMTDKHLSRGGGGDA